jgi:hypothetical protein
MAGDWVGPDLVFGGMTTFFVITGILSLRDAAAGVLCVRWLGWGVRTSRPVARTVWRPPQPPDAPPTHTHVIPGFSNTGVLTVMMLYLVAEGVTQTGGLDLAMNLMLGRASTTFWAQVKMGCGQVVLSSCGVS